MDATTLYQEFYQKKILTDLTLTIKDDNSKDDNSKDADNSIVIDVHKLVLCAYSPYFHKLFCQSFKESKLDKLSIAVPNAAVCYDIIMAAYHQQTNRAAYPKLQHALWLVICSDYLGLEPDYDLLRRSDWSDSELEYVTSLYHLFSVNERMVQLLYDHLSPTYPLPNLPQDVQTHLLQLATKSDIVVTTDLSINIYDSQSGKIKLVNYLLPSYVKTYYLPATRCYFYQHQDRSDLIKNQLDRRNVIAKTNISIHYTASLCAVCYSADESKVAFVLRYASAHYYLLIYQTDTCYQLHMFTIKHGLEHLYANNWITYAKFSPDNSYIICGSWCNMLVCYMTGEYFYLKPVIVEEMDRIHDVTFSTDGVQLFVQGTGMLTYDITNIAQPIITPVNTPAANPVCYLPDSKQIIISIDDSCPYIYDLASKTIAHIFLDASYPITFTSCQTREQKIIMVNKNTVYLYHSQSKQLEHKITLSNDLPTTYRMYYTPAHDPELTDKLKKLKKEQALALIQ